LKGRGIMAKDHALEEIKKLFPRQRKVNAVDVFITVYKKPHQKFHFGTNEVNHDSFDLLTPDRSFFSDRFFKGSELSFAVCTGYNEKYGLIALIAQLYKLTENRSVGREIVRAFTKHAIFITSKHFSNYIDDSIINRNNIIFQSRDKFYVAVFDQERIKAEMRGKFKTGKARKHTKQKKGKTDVRLDTDLSQRADFIAVCKANGLSAIEQVLNEVATLTYRVDREKVFFSIANLIRYFSRPTNKIFYKRVKEIFGQG
jgi:hypothetical protein